MDLGVRVPFLETFIGYTGTSTVWLGSSRSGLTSETHELPELV